jgi:hypothetical protein
MVISGGSVYWLDGVIAFGGGAIFSYTITNTTTLPSSIAPFFPLANCH